MKRTFDLSLAQRLAGGFLLLIVVLFAMLWVLIVRGGASAAAQALLTEEIAPRAAAAATLERTTLYVAISLRRYLHQPDAGRLLRFEDNAAEALDALARLEAQPMGAEDQALVNRLHPLLDAYIAEARRVVAARRLGAVSMEVEGALGDQREEMLSVLREFVHQQNRQSAQAMAAMTQARAALTRDFAGAAIAGSLVFALVAFAISWSLRRPVQRLVEVSDALTAGDYQPAMQWLPREGVSVRDELVRLGHGLGRAAEAVQRRERRLDAERALAIGVANSLDREAVAEAALAIVLEHVGAQVGVVYVHVRGNSHLVPVTTHALATQATPLAIGEGIPGQAAREKRPVILQGLPDDAPFKVRLGYDEAAPRSVAAFPILCRDEVEGVLLVASLRALDGDAVSFLEGAAVQLGVAFDNLAAYDEIQRLVREVQEKNEEIQAQNEELQSQNEELQSQNEEIQAQSEELRSQADELLQKSDQLRAHADALDLADQRKNDFLATLGHELRNPMAPIANAVFILRHAGGDPDRTGRALAVLDRQSRHLTGLVDDLLDVARIARGKVHLDKARVDVAAVARACAEDLRPQFEERRLELGVEAPGPANVFADPTRMAQVIANLLGNALKFTPPGGHVWLAVERDPEGGRARVRVRDDGAGIDPEVLPVLFRPFAQGPRSPNTPNGGLGLGLALVKGLAELHGGMVECHSEGTGRGAEFVVTLPLLEGTAEAQPARKRRAAPSRRRVLVVEDNLDAAWTLREALEISGQQVEVASDGAQALERAATFAPEVVLCDIGLPGMDGYELARRFRADPRLRSAYLVALTGYGSPEDRRRVVDAGFHRHLIKPLDLEDVADLLASVGERAAEPLRGP